MPPSAIVAAQPKSAEPILTVLPFDNLSTDPEMQFFSDGVSEEIIQRLSRARVLAQRRGRRRFGKITASPRDCAQALLGRISPPL